MKILLVAYKHDYDNEWRRTNREYGEAYHRWYVPLVKIAAERGHIIITFWADEEIIKNGRSGFNPALRNTIFGEKPDVSIFYTSEEDLDKNVLADIKANSPTVSIYFCGDDSWRFNSVSKHFAPYFSWVVTWFFKAREWYVKIGCNNVIQSHVGVSTKSWHPVPAEKTIDVSFVGRWSRSRGEIVQKLVDAGINIIARGNGWPGGSISDEEMLRLYSSSKMAISLNPSDFYIGWRSIARLFLRRAYFGEAGPMVKWDGANFFANLRSWLEKRTIVSKGRIFEVTACDTMLITKRAENEQDYYIPGKEIVFYTDMADLIAKINYYLAHPDESAAIAHAGYRRTLRDHTTEKRLETIFATIGHPL